MLFVYSNPHGDKGEYSYVSDIFDSLSYSGKYYNIEFKDAEFLEVNAMGVESWIEEIDHFFAKNAKLRKTMRIVVLLFANNEKNYYGELKKYITNQLALPCQVILRKTAEHKSKTTILGKIALQINAKSGNTLWSVQTKHPFWSKKRIAYGAFSISKNVRQDTKRKGKI